jgi:bifunctional non-homologous end joining protein LigD
VVGGFTDPQKSRGHFGALLLGVRQGGKLVYAGKVGTGFSSESLREIKGRLVKLERKTAPFANPPRGAEAKGVHWLEPRMVAEVEFAERTQDGRVRHASFRGLRKDKPAAEVTDERVEKGPERREKRRAVPRAAGGRASPAPSTLDASRIRLTHPDRVLYPEQGLTKKDLALYYAKVSSWMLPHVAGRPLMIVRCPEGTGKTCFHQKHASKGMPRAVTTVDVEGAGGEPHLMIEDVEGLIGLVQMGALEIHTWGSTRDVVECPERLVFDLDPDEALPWKRVAEAARSLKGDLEAAGLTPFLKTTGGKGLHLVVPVEPVTPWEEAKAFCKALVQQRSKAEPAKYLSVMNKEKRKGKIFLDYLRNGRGSTAVCAFSTRARPSAEVSAPIAWEELSDRERPAFDVNTLPERLASLTEDPWAEFESARAPIPNA